MKVFSPYWLKHASSPCILVLLHHSTIAFTKVSHESLPSSKCQVLILVHSCLHGPMLATSFSLKFPSLVFHDLLQLRLLKFTKVKFQKLFLHILSLHHFFPSPLPLRPSAPATQSHLLFLEGAMFFWTLGFLHAIPTSETLFALFLAPLILGLSHCPSDVC